MAKKEHTISKLIILVALFGLIAASPTPLEPMESAFAEPEEELVIEEKQEPESSPKLEEIDEVDKETSQPTEAVFDPQNSATWPDCDDGYIVRADNGECAKRATPVKRETPAPAPTPARTTRTASGGCEQYRSLLSQYSWNVETMMRAMRLESSCNPNAVGDQYTINGVYAPSCGLLQVRTLPGRPSCEQLKDPAFNIATAYKIWQGQGYRAWTVLH